MSFKHGLISLLVIFILISVFAAGIAVSQPNQLEIINNSTHTISKVTVIVGGEEYTFNELESNTAKSSWYFYNGTDSEFDVHIYYKNGHSDRLIGGYMSSGIFFSLTVIKVSPDLEITLATE